jgi:hypothetical protein
MTTTTTQELASITERFVREMILSYTLNWEGQRIYGEAYEEACEEAGDGDGPDDEHAPWQYRMDVGQRMKEEGDKMTIDVEERAKAAGVDMDVLGDRVAQLLDRPRVR